MGTRSVDRRSFLALSAGVCGAASGLGARSFARQAPASSDAARISALCDELIALPRERTIERAVEWIKSGATRAELLAAAFLAGLREVRPQPVGGALHCTMAIESAFVIVERARAQDRWSIVLWALDDFKASQASARARGSWNPRKLPNKTVAASKAFEELRRGLDAYDPERAFGALEALLLASGPRPVFEVLRPYAARSLTDAGHRILHLAQAERALERIEGHGAELALRSIVFGLTDDAPGPHTHTYLLAQERQAALPANWRGGSNEPAHSLQVLSSLRGKSPVESLEGALDAFGAGFGARAVWDGLRLYASELMLLRKARKRLFPVHMVTELEAFGALAERTSSERDARVLVLQAAAWLAAIRDAVARQDGAFDAPPAIEAFAEVGPASPEDPEPRSQLGAALAARDPLRAGRALLAQPALSQMFVDDLCSGLARASQENHMPKYLAAVLIEAERVDPRWRAHILVPGLEYLPGAASEPSDVAQRSEAALALAGLIENGRAAGRPNAAK